MRGTPSSSPSRRSQRSSRRTHTSSPLVRFPMCVVAARCRMGEAERMIELVRNELRMAAILVAHKYIISIPHAHAPGVGPGAMKRDPRARSSRTPPPRAQAARHVFPRPGTTPRTCTPRPQAASGACCVSDVPPHAFKFLIFNLDFLLARADAARFHAGTLLALDGPVPARAPVLAAPDPPPLPPHPLRPSFPLRPHTADPRLCLRPTPSGSSFDLSTTTLP
ncbi:hypothetical protein JB92DRAFT_3132179 [Gautieria morchelliformis]|nr:hypothetical protein JB92DRAFT_3132179 [Gautieria morchelliformis]